jgi:hypothetical protein
MQKEEEAANLERWALELENLGTRPARLQWNVPQVQDSLTQGNDDQNNGRLGSGCESDMMLNDDSGCVLGDVISSYCVSPLRVFDAPVGSSDLNCGTSF